MRMPFDGRVRLTSPYGKRELVGTSGQHQGIDLVALDDPTVLSPVAGVVAAAEWIVDKTNPNWMWGNHVILAGDDGRVYFFFHLAERSVERFDRITVGQPLGRMGNTGYSFGAHLHFEVRLGDAATPIDPTPLLGIENREGLCVVTEPADAAPGGDNPSDWAADATAWAKQNGIFLSDGDGNYRWTAPITREEVAVVLKRLDALLRAGDANERKETL